MQKIRQKKSTILLLILVLCITVGYALLSTEVKIVGASKIKNAKWDIHLDNLAIKEGSVEAVTDAFIDDSKTIVNYNVDLNELGDYYEFTVDVVNEGSIDGMIDNITSKIKINDNDYLDITEDIIPNYLNYQVTYESGAKIIPKQELKRGERETYKVRIEYKNNLEEEDLPTTEQNLQFMFAVNYVQKDSTSIEIPKLKVGDYISLTPDKDSFTIKSEITGYENDQFINPSELTLWRIIKKNSDGTFDAISEYASSKEIFFNGTTGYQNIVGGLQEIAKEYTKTGYTIKARSFGYDNQTSTISDTSSFDGSDNYCPTINTTPKPTTGEGDEFNNGIFGDTLYLKDYQLVNEIYNKLETNKLNKTIPTSYWVASRAYIYNDSNSYSFNGCNISTTGNIICDDLFRSYNEEWTSMSKGHPIRPIITIYGNLLINNGKGTLNEPYLFS